MPPDKIKSGGPRRAEAAPRAPLGAWAAAAWAAFVLAAHLRYYIREVPIRPGLSLKLLPGELAVGPHFAAFWLGHIPRALVCALFFLGAWALGSLLLRRFLPDAAENRLAPMRAPFALGLGLGALGYAAFALFALGLARHWVFAALYAPLSLLGLAQVARTLRDSRAREDGESPAWTGTQKAWAAFLLAASVLAFLGSTQPEISYDALAYHLAVPQTYLSAGRMIELPYNHFSYLPLLNSMLHAWALALDGMPSAKLMNCGLGFCLLFSLFGWGRVLKGRELALATCALFLATPLVLYLFWAVNSDFLTALYLLLALAAAWAWLRERERNGPLYLAGLFGGLALASKYTAAFGVAALVPILGRALWGMRREAPARALLLAVFLAAPLIPWWARNAAYTGNPFYPYLTETLGPSRADPELLRSWTDETRNGSPGLRPLAHSRKIWSDAVSGFSNVAFNYTGPLFLALLPLAFLALGEAWARFTAGYLLLSFLLGFSGTYLTRLLLGYYAPLALLLAFSLSALPRAVRRLLLALSVSALLLNAYLLSHLLLLTSFEGLRVASGRTSADEYLRRPRNLYPNPSYGAYEFLRALDLGPEERILAVGESRAFYSPRLTLAGAPHDIPPAFAWANASASPRELDEKLRAEGIAAVVSNPREGSRNDPPKHVTARGVTLISSVLERSFDKVYTDPWTEVYRRKNSARGGRE